MKLSEVRPGMKICLKKLPDGTTWYDQTSKLTYNYDIWKRHVGHIFEVSRIWPEKTNAVETTSWTWFPIDWIEEAVVPPILAGLKEEFRGFCDRCGGFRAHRRGCPKPMLYL